MVQFLKDQGYTVVPLRWKELNSTSHWQYPIDYDHVVLFSMMCCRREASWFVMHRDNTFHNMLHMHVLPRTMLGKPILTAYLIWHPKWTSAGAKKK